MEYTVHEAKTHFSKLISAMRQGHDVVITSGRRHEPIARVVPYEPKSGGIRLGLYANTELANISLDEVLAPAYTEAELDEIDRHPFIPESE